MSRILNLVVPLLLLASMAGCSRKHYRESADREAAVIIAAKGTVVPNMPTNFTIAVLEKMALAGLPTKAVAEQIFGTNGDFEVSAQQLSLVQALDIAVKNSRNYQNRKEALYLQALSLALTRHRYTPIYSVDGAATYAQTVSEVQENINSIIVERTLREQTVGGGGSVRADYLLRTGGRLAVDFTTDFLRFITGDPRVTSSSALVATFTQPLLRGGGKAAAEPITQAERDMLYALREFVRFRQEFTIDIVSRYYRALQNRDAMANSYRALMSLTQNVERETANVDVGRRAAAQLDEIQQAALNAEIGWINAIRQYQQSLDDFKITIGLPLETMVFLDPAELRRLQIAHPDIPEADATKVALFGRLDLYNQRDQFEDAVRQVAVAANGLLPKVDIAASASYGGVRTGGGFPEINWDTYRWNAGLDVDLPIDRKAERNSYRAALINQDRSARELELAMDNIRLQIREDWRALDQARRTFEISKMGVGIADRRVEEQNIRLDIGLGLAKDLVDAQAAQLNSQNALTAALVGHTLARLRFYRDMGLLTINEDGTWHEDSPNLSAK